MHENNRMPYCPVYGNEQLEAMYPAVYHMVYPRVKHYTEMHDVPTNPNMYPYPSQVQVEQMTNQIYQDLMANPHSVAAMQQFGDGFDGRFLRPLILILLLRELQRRRRFRFFF